MNNKLWIARDKDGTLIMFHEKPIRCGDYWGTSDNNEVFTITEGLFPNLKWEDEPIEVSLIETFRLMSLQALK